jgi:hypothetical protein
LVTAAGLEWRFKQARQSPESTIDRRNCLNKNAQPAGDFAAKLEFGTENYF